MSMRARCDALLRELGVERGATMIADVKALAAAVGVEFSGLAPTLGAVEAECFGAAGAPPAPPAPAPAVKPEAAAEAGGAPGDPAAADSDSDIECLGSQTEAERTAAARARAEREHDVVAFDEDDEDDDLKGLGVKALKAIAAARGADISGCREKAELIAAIRAAPAALEAAPPAPAPAPAPPSGAVRRLTKQIIARVNRGATHYEVLGLETSSTTRDVTVAYRDIAALIHPDKCSEGGAEAAFKKVNEAREVLGDAARRGIYDAQHAAAPPVPPSPAPAPAPRARAPKRKKPAAKPKKPARKGRRYEASDDDSEEEEAFEEEDSDDDSEDDDEDDEESDEEEDEVVYSDDSDEEGGLADQDGSDLDEETTVAELKQMCKAQGLKVTGTKGVLLKRLRDAKRGIYDRPLPRAAPRPKKKKARRGYVEVHVSYESDSSSSSSDY